MDEPTAGRLEMAGQRALRLLGGTLPTGGAHENSGGPGRPPGNRDVEMLASRIVHESSVDSARADAYAREIVTCAKSAMDKLTQGGIGVRQLTEIESMSLESVIHVRGRPALRVFDNSLEGLDKYPGSEFWQEYISDFGKGMIAAAHATGAVIVSSFSSGYPPWVQGTAWLISPNHVVTNRHVLHEPGQYQMAGPDAQGENHLLGDYEIAINFTNDNRMGGTSDIRKVKSILYLAAPGDPVDIAVLEIEPFERAAPLALDPTDSPGINFYVIGHPGALSSPASEITAVFGNLDGRKRVSFGKRFSVDGTDRDLVHDASTVGGYSGGPVVAISRGTVSGLHYYGDPMAGNLAVTAAVIRGHPAYQFFHTGHA